MIDDKVLSEAVASLRDEQAADRHKRRLFEIQMRQAVWLALDVVETAAALRRAEAWRRRFAGWLFTDARHRNRKAESEACRDAFRLHLAHMADCGFGAPAAILLKATEDITGEHLSDQNPGSTP